MSDRPVTDSATPSAGTEESPNGMFPGRGPEPAHRRVARADERPSVCDGGTGSPLWLPALWRFSSCSSAYCRHWAPTTQPRHTDMAAQMLSAVPSQNASGSVWAHKAESRGHGDGQCGGHGDPFQGESGTVPGLMRATAEAAGPPARAPGAGGDVTPGEARSGDPWGRGPHPAGTPDLRNRNRVRIVRGVSKDPEPLLAAVEEVTAQSLFRVRDAHVLFTDGTWRRCRVLAWARDREHGWAARIRWPTGECDWRRYDPRYIHPV